MPDAGSGVPESGEAVSGDLAKKGPRPPRSERDEAGGDKPVKSKRASAKKKEPKARHVRAGKADKPKKDEKPARMKKAPRAKKERKPLFGKKKSAEHSEVSAEPSEAIAEVSGDSERKPKKSLFGKKGPKQKKVSGAAKPPKKKKQKGSRGGSIGGSKMSPVGLDIGRTSITAARLKHQTGGSILLQAELDKLPEGLVSEGEVLDVDALAFAIKDFWKTHKIKGQRVSLGLANQKVVVRAIDFPVMDEKELQSSIEFQVQDYIPIPAEEAVFAHHIMGTSIDDDGIEMQKVLIVAAQKDMVMDFVNAVKKAKLQVDNIDLQAFAMMRAMRSGSFLDEHGSREAIAIANIASDLTNIVVEVNGEPQFTRIISFGGDDFTKAVAEHQGLKFDEAELIKIKAGMPDTATAHAKAEGHQVGPAAPSEKMPPAEQDGYGPLSGLEEELRPPAPEGGFGPPDERMETADGDEAPLSEDERIAQVQRILEIVSETLADELRRSFDYYMSQESAVPISMLLLSGGGALMPNLDSHLSQLFPFEVRMGDPSARIVGNKSDLSDEELKVLGPRLAIAVGLALEDEGP